MRMLSWMAIGVAACCTAHRAVAQAQVADQSDRPAETRSTATAALTPYWHMPATAERLAALPALPKPHPTITWPNGIVATDVTRRCAGEVMRITGVCQIRSDLLHKIDSGRPWGETLFGIAQAAGVRALCVTIHHPWDVRFPSLAAQQGTEVMDYWPGRWGLDFTKLYHDLVSIRTMAAEYGLEVRYAVIGQEWVISRAGNDAFNARLNDFHRATYAVIRSACPEADVVFYSRGNIAPNLGIGGWGVRPLYTLDESFAGEPHARYLCCDCYHPHAWVVREQLRRMAEFAQSRGRGERVIPWTCLGRGYDRILPAAGHGNETVRFRIGVHNPSDWWMIGRWLNWEYTAWVKAHGAPLFARRYAEVVAGTYGATSRVYAGDIPFVVLWPGPFDHRDPEGHWLVDFEAYVLGATATLPTGVQLTLPNPAPPSGDLDASGQVDLQDFAIFQRSIKGEVK